MFDFDAGKLLIIGVIALIVIGPKELPRVLRQVGQAVGRMRRMASEFQGQFMDAMKEADIQSIREEIEKAGRDAELNVNFDPARDIQSELTRTLEAPAPAVPLPALETATVALPTDGFTLPAPVEAEASAVAEAEIEAISLAGAGLAPVAADGAGHELQAAPAIPSRKRKIVLPKRGPLRRSARHQVSDRTGMPRRRAGIAAPQQASDR